LNKAVLDKLKSTQILLVEDNEFNQMVAIDTLQSLLPGIQIDLAQNGQEAVDKIQAKQYHMVLMDINMPIMDGMQATQKIRKLEGDKKHTKIIAMTANVMEEDVRHYLEIGMNGHISKPFVQKELLRKMAEMLQWDMMTSQIEEKATIKNPFGPLPDRVIDMNFLQQFTNGDLAKQNKYITMFLDNAPKLLAQLHEGLANHDFDMIKISAHSLKPQLSYMGVTEEVSNVFMLEQSAGQKAHQNNIPELVENVERVCNKAFEELRAYVKQ
jgi:CheY-like chemotaxis protein